MNDVVSLGGVAATAVGAARVRAEESRRADRLFHDPYAELFVAAAPPGTLPEEHTARVSDLAQVGVAFCCHGIVRTRFFDDYLQAAASAGCRQVVLLAAGLDTRAFRLTWPESTQVFELDSPAVQRFKQRVLDQHAPAPSCDRRPIETDLRQDWPAALAERGFVATVPTAWLAEGLLVYLTAEEADRLLTSVTILSAPGSQLALESGSAASRTVIDQARQLPSMQRFTGLWKGGLGTDPAAWLRKNGWATHAYSVDELARSYDRAAPASTGGRVLAANR